MDLFRVNPPLVRAVAALPVMATGYSFDWEELSREVSTRRPWHRLGRTFAESNGSRYHWLTLLSRLVCIPFSLVGCYVCFRWSSELWESPGAGLLSLALWCFSPNILGHASLINSDCAAASFGLAAGYTFWRWLKDPQWRTAGWAGLALGIAELSKFSWSILFLLWPVVGLANWLTNRSSTRRVATSVHAVQLTAILAMGLYILNAGYGFQGTLTPLREFRFESELLAGEVDEFGNGNRFSDHWIGAIPVPLPSQYVLGVDFQMHDFDQSGPVVASYVNGQWRNRGWWWYYLYGLAIKVPHGTQLIFLLAVGFAIYRSWGSSRVRLGRDLLVLLGPMLAIFLLVSSQTKFSAHFRYVLPSFGMAFVFCGILCTIPNARWCRSVVWGGLLATATSTSFNLPYSLSYFNEISGGRQRGGQRMLGSSFDWGQGLTTLDKALERHPEWGPVAIAYSGMLVPMTIGTRAQLIDFTKDVPLAGFSHVAISANILAGRPYASAAYPVTGARASDFERFFREQDPVDRLDETILVFDAAPFNEYSRNRIGNTEQTNSIVSPVRLPDLNDGRGNLISVSGFVHVLLRYGLGPTSLGYPPSGREAFRCLTDDELARESSVCQSLFVRTPHGLRYRLISPKTPGIREGEAHRDQCLSAFASVGISLDERLRHESGLYRVNDLLMESIANFTFDQAELTWTAHAYASYLPPKRTWTNRFGNQFTFSQLTSHLLTEGVAGKGCGGAHVLQALLSIRRADLRFGILDRETRVELHQFLDQCSQLLLANQNEDGSWDTQWFRNPADKQAEREFSFESKLIVTGHMAELCGQFPSFVRRDMQTESIRWLRGVLEEERYIKESASICPLTHGLNAIRFERYAGGG